MLEEALQPLHVLLILFLFLSLSVNSEIFKCCLHLQQYFNLKSSDHLREGESEFVSDFF
jgi:hypothetical protein